MNRTAAQSATSRPEALVLVTTSADQTRNLAAAVAPLSLPGDVLLLAGDLGAGKTAFAQGFGAGLGITDQITSPTFTLVRSYPVAVRSGVRTLLHADVYRLDHLHEIVDLGLGELVEDGGVALVEWGDVAEPVLGEGSLTVRLDGDGEDTERRVITVASGGDGWWQRWTGLVGGARAMACRPVRLLAIETATDTVGVGLVETDGGSAERVHVGGRVHAELLVPAIEEVCAVSGCVVSDIEVIGVDVGPGLFTGLRVGVATAKALAQALGIGVVAVSSLDVLAAAAAARATGAARSGPATVERVVSVVDARRGEVFAAAYRFDRSTAGEEPVDPASVRDDRLQPMSPEALVDWLVDLVEESGDLKVVGDGAARYRPLLAVHPGLDLGWVDEFSAPPPLALARLALQRLARGAAPLTGVEVVPDYRRPADARINWEQRAPRVPSSGSGRGRVS